jgi:PIN domain nuclease of toxin-antitoxin system
MLLDTHVLLWFLDDNPKLLPKVKEMIEEGDNIMVSIVTLWEIAIKLSIKKLDVQFEFQELTGFLDQLGIVLLPLCFNDIQCYINLPLHHRDPFDRILISQAINNSLVIVSADTAFDAYLVQRVWA